MGSDGGGMEDLLIPSAMHRVRPPISRFPVGAVGLGESRRVYAGVNLDFFGAPLSQAVHAEQFLIANVAAVGEPVLRVIAVSHMPCDHCRQFLQEIRCAAGIRILVTSDAADGCAAEWRTLASLLPRPFGPHDLLPKDAPSSSSHMTAASTLLLGDATIDLGPHRRRHGCTGHASDNSRHRADSRWMAWGEGAIEDSDVGVLSVDVHIAVAWDGRRGTGRRDQITKDVSAQGTERDSRAVQFSFESEDQNPSFMHLVRSDDRKPGGVETQASQEPPAEWGPEGGPSLASGPDDGNLPYPCLPTVLEEPSTSFSEVAEDDPLPAIDGLRITGEAFRGKELQAMGTPFGRWIGELHRRCKTTHIFSYHDDVDSLLAIEVQPLDDRKRKGEIVKIYANEQRKITCDPEMKELIKKILFVGHVSYEVLLPINIPYGHPTEFSIQSADGAEYNLKPGDNSS
ncbi:hypothetical protein ZWY2020_032503 [Hordeum vulgare]|nr:hypothetical protein ZWY2020_032503 [Hordeum vulgare]